MKVTSTTPSPNDQYLGDMKVGQIAVLSVEGQMQKGHYLRTYESLVYLEDPSNTYNAEAFFDENEPEYAVRILNPGSEVTLRITP
jgi:hypothetical protein